MFKYSGAAKDLEIWSFAGERNFVIVTRDSDFSELATLHGSPPKVIVLQISNCRLRDMASPIIKKHAESFQSNHVFGPW